MKICGSLMCICHILSEYIWFRQGFTETTAAIANMIGPPLGGALYEVTTYPNLHNTTHYIIITRSLQAWIHPFTSLTKLN